ncbi:MAG TPA: fumarylacetoacetate hydrolase family protein [Terriglobia bacterium]|nr:fumarylacetoacetate hydrolase family protein [Terriglobia bacterium]
MKLFRTRQGIILEEAGAFSRLPGTDWDNLINDDGWLQKPPDVTPCLAPTEAELLAPISSQEVWAAGVTYYRSRDARMEESKDAGGGDFYAKVYEAERPELFFKAPPYRVVGSGAPVRIRRDAKWSVPEPELTLVINNRAAIIGYTIGNDMSSRDIEGENPLYLPQAKVYDGSCALGPCVYLTHDPLPPDTKIDITIRREGKVAFSGGTTLRSLKRSLTDLVAYLYRETSFPHGCLLMTGTGIVPPTDFTLQRADEITIKIGGIGELCNRVE